MEVSAALLEPFAAWSSFRGGTEELSVLVSPATGLRSTAPTSFVAGLNGVESRAGDFTSGGAVISGDGLWGVASLLADWLADEVDPPLDEIPIMVAPSGEMRRE